MKRFAFVFGLAAVAFSASTARADVAYQYVTDLPGNSFTGVQGSTVTVGIYLQETVTKGTSYLAGDGGLFGAGYQLTVPTANLNGASVSAQTGQNGAGGSFAGGVFTPTGPTVQGTNTFWRSVQTTSLSATSGPLGTVDGAVTKILLGTATFTVGTASTTFSLGKKTSGTSTQSFNSMTNLDIDNSTLGISGAGDLTTPIAINLQAVVLTPEPSSMALCGLAACSMGIGAWRRYKAKKKAGDSAKVEEVAV